MPLYIKLFVFIHNLPNGKVINYNNTLYYGVNKTQIATNNQISSLQTQITGNNNNLQNQINNTPITIQSSKTVTGAKYPKDNYSIYTLPSGYRFCAFIINGSYNFSSGTTSYNPNIEIYFTDAIQGTNSYPSRINLITIDSPSGSNWPYACVFFYYPTLNKLQWGNISYTLQNNNIYIVQNNNYIINNITITGYCFK